MVWTLLDKWEGRASEGWQVICSIILSKSNHQKISELITEAIKHQWQLVLIIDDHLHPHQTQTYNRQAVSVKINVHHNNQGL